MRSMRATVGATTRTGHIRAAHLDEGQDQKCINSRGNSMEETEQLTSGATHAMVRSGDLLFYVLWSPRKIFEIYFALSTRIPLLITLKLYAFS